MKLPMTGMLPTLDNVYLPRHIKCLSTFNFNPLQYNLKLLMCILKASDVFRQHDVNTDRMMKFVDIITI